MSRPLLVASVLVLASFAVPSFAQETNYDRTTRNEVRREVVTFGDLNLNTEHGADQLVRRIEIAAGHVCGDRVGRRELTENRLVRDCTGAAEEEAVYDVGHPMVLARYYGRSPEIYIDEDEDVVAYYPDGSVVVYDGGD